MMTIDNQLKIRYLEVQDIGEAMELVLAEGWNQTPNDWRCLIQNRQNVCLAAEINGKLVGTACASNYDNQIAWIGMVLVQKAFRGQGISKMMLSSLFEHLQSCKSIKLDATPAGQPVYKKLGFEEEYLISRMVKRPQEKITFPENDRTSNKIQMKDIPEIIALDRQVFGADRSHLISSLVSNYPEKSIVLKRDNRIEAFCLGRQGNRFHQCGPLAAKTLGDAKTLVSFILQDSANENVVIDVPNDKAEMIEWLNTKGFEKQRQFTRMFLHRNPFPGNVQDQYFICGPEFG